MLQRRNYLGAAGMADKMIDVFEPEAVAGEEVGRDLAQLGRDELWDVARKDRAKAVIGNRPAHDVEAVGPGVLTVSDDGRAHAVRREQRSGCTVTKQCRRDDIALRPIVPTKGERTELDGQEQYCLSWRDGGQTGRARQADDTAGAAEPEYRQPAHCAPHPHSFDQQRIEARRRNTGCRDDYDAVDLALVAAGPIEELQGRRFEQIRCGSEIDAVALRPTMLPVVPFDRHAGIARADSRIGKHRQQTVAVLRAAEQALDALNHVVLIERVGRDRSGDAEQAWASRHRGTGNAPA